MKTCSYCNRKYREPHCPICGMSEVDDGSG